MTDLSIFKLDSQTINIKDTTARQTADSAKTLATTASGNATTALNKINEIDREFFRMIPKGGTVIPNGANLNSTAYLKVGNYYQPANVNTTNMTNIPFKAAFMMYVLSPLSEVYDIESTAQWVYRLRIFISYNGQHIFTQMVNSESTPGNFNYSPWIKLTNSNDLGVALNKINELEKLSRVSISYDSTKENITITNGTHSVA